MALSWSVLALVLFRARPERSRLGEALRMTASAALWRAAGLPGTPTTFIRSPAPPLA